MKGCGECVVSRNRSKQKGSIVEGVTIVIPTYNNRSRYLTRILSYYASFGGRAPLIIVADASAIPNRLDTFDTFKNRIRVIHFPSNINAYHKFMAAAREVQTKYVLFCGDDDFITLHGIKESIDFLEEHPDYSCAQGMFVSFRMQYDESDNAIMSWGDYGNGRSIGWDQAEKRFLEHCSNYQATFYGVHRTTDLLAFLEETARQTDDYRFGELVPSMLATIYGKIKVLEIMYGAREISATSTSQAGQGWADVINSGHFRTKYNKVILCLARHLQMQSGLSMRSAERTIEGGLQIYFSQVFGKVISACIRHKIHPILYRGVPMLLRRYGIFYPLVWVLIWAKKAYKAPGLRGENKGELKEFLDSWPEGRSELSRIEKFSLESACHN